MLVHRALLAVDEGDVTVADEALAVLATVPDDGTDPRMTALRKAAALHRARLAADLAVAHASDLVEDVGPSHLPADLDPDVRLLVLADRGALRLFEGDHSRARRDLHQAIELARAAGLHSVLLYCANLVAGTYVAGNDFTNARTAAEEAIAFAAARGWDRTPSLAYSYMLAGWTAFQVLRPEEAATCAAISLDVIDTTVDVEVEGAARTGEAIVAFDEPPQRRAALERLDRTTAWLTDRGASPALIALAAPHELRMCLSLGEWHRAEQAVERAQARLGASGDVVVLQAQLASARGRPADARRLLRPVLSGDLPPIRATALVTAWLLEALLAERSDRRPAATEALLTALQVAAPTGASRPFFDAGAEVHTMLSALRGRAGHLEPVLDSALAGIAHVLEWQGVAADGRHRASARRDDGTHRRVAHRARARGAARPPVDDDPRRDRDRPGHQPEHRQDARALHLRQARRGHPARGHRHRARASVCSEAGASATGIRQRSPVTREATPPPGVPRFLTEAGRPGPFGVERESMRYEFIIRGSVSDDVMAALPELSSTPYPTGGTVLFGPVQDESDVSSLLARFSDLGLSVVEMRRLPD